MSSSNSASKVAGPSSSKRKADGNVNGTAVASTSSSSAKKVKPSATDEDDEWALFQKEVLSAADADEGRSLSEAVPSRPVASAAKSGPSTANPPSTTYASATIEVAPQLRNGDQGGQGKEGAVSDAQEEETEEQKRRRKLREEKEEIYSRIEEEQRLQDEAQDR